MADVPATAQDPAQNIALDPDVGTNPMWRLTTDVTDACPSFTRHPTPVLEMMCMCFHDMIAYLVRRELTSPSIDQSILHP